MRAITMAPFHRESISVPGAFVSGKESPPITPDTPLQNLTAQAPAAAEPTTVETPAGAVRGRPKLAHGIALAAITVLVIYIAVQGAALLDEGFSLSTEASQASDTVVVGYVNIAVNPSLAAAPENWCHDDGEFTLLWSGWRENAGHGWFRVGRGELDRRRVSHPIGRDAALAIDYPLVEIEGGPTWQRVPTTARVAGFKLGDVPSAYPIYVLQKVEVVNDSVGDRPCLVTYSPLSRSEESVAVYDPVLDGRRLTMGFSGYLHDRKPLFYDRGTESLWVDQAQGLCAIAGKHKGAKLLAITRPEPVSWRDWRSRNPTSRLLVGANRSRPLPEF